MTQTERKAFNWLSRQGNVLLRGKTYPRFMTSEGKGFHAKRLYTHSIIFSDAEVEVLKEQEVTILVFDGGDEPLFSFPFSEIDFSDRKWHHIDIHVIPWRDMLKQRGATAAIAFEASKASKARPK